MNARSILRGLSALAAALVLSTTAQAQLFRTYLAINGNDANPCTLPQPCRLLPAAINAVADGGEIWMLDSANYNTAPVAVGKSVSILAVPGAVGSVLATGGPAVTISASGLEVALRNLVVLPLPGGGGTHSILMTGASTLTIENSVIANAVNTGIAVTAGTVRVVDSVIRGGAGYAIWVENGARGVVSGTRISDNFGGIAAYSSVVSVTTLVTVEGCVITGGSTGVSASNMAAGSVTRAVVKRTMIEGTTYGLMSQTNDAGTAILTVSGSTVANGDHSWYRAGTGSLLRTAGDNLFTDNVTSFGALTPVSLQ